MTPLDIFFCGLIAFVAIVIVYRILCWRWEDAKREAEMERVSLSHRNLLIQISDAAFLYRGYANSIHIRRARARKLDRLLVQYRELKK